MRIRLFTPARLGNFVSIQRTRYRWSNQYSIHVAVNSVSLLSKKFESGVDEKLTLTGDFLEEDPLVPVIDHRARLVFSSAIVDQDWDQDWGRPVEQHTPTELSKNLPRGVCSTEILPRRPTSIFYG